MGLYTAGAEEFFNRARSVYLTQDQTGHLKLSPFFKIGKDKPVPTPEDLDLFRTVADRQDRIPRLLGQQDHAGLYLISRPLGAVGNHHAGTIPFIQFPDKPG